MTLLSVAVSQIDSMAQLAPHKITTFLAGVPPVKSTPPPFSGALMMLAGWLLWIATLACSVGVVITGIRIVISFRGGGDANIAQLAWVLFGCILVGGASGIVNQFI